MTPFAATPDPPYYAVIFTSVKTTDNDGYGETVMKMVGLAMTMPGYLGLEFAGGEPGATGITVSYWATEADIANWKQQMDHLAAQETGKTRWYEHYELRVAKVERAYSGPAGR